MLALAFNVGLVHAQAETVYINADGSITPSGAPIVTSDSITYTVTGNMNYPTYNGIVVERNDTVLDGGGHTIQGEMVGDSNGIYLTGLSNVTIRNVSIKSFFYGIYEGGCSNDSVLEANLSGNSYGVYVSGGQYNVLSGNNVSANTYAGVWLYYSYNNNVTTNSMANSISSNYGGLVLYCSNYNYIVGNNLTSNDYGVYVYDCELNYIFHNNFLSNVLNAYVTWDMGTSPPGNYWDNGYPSGGNYWSDYNGQDMTRGPSQNLTGSDGIGDTPYTIDSADMDNYPLMNPYCANSLYADISSSSTTLDVDQLQLFNSVASGGALAYSYQWYVNGTPVSGAVLSDWTFTPSSPGSYSIYLNVTDNTGFTAESNTASVNVYPWPTVNVSPTSIAMDIGGSHLFASTVSGGIPPYTYQWLLNNALISGATNATWTFTPTLTGYYAVYVEVTDSVGVSGLTFASVTVNKQPSVIISIPSVTMDFGQSQPFTCNVSGGTSPYSYQWYLNGTQVPGATGSEWMFVPSSSGSFTVYLNVTDSAGQVATSNNVLITVNRQLSVIISSSSVTMDFGQSQLFNSTVSGGTSVYLYQWYLNGSPVSGATDITWTFTPASAGSYTVYLNVTDSVSAVAMSNSIPVTVNEPLSISITSTSVAMDTGQSHLFTSIVSGGTSPFTYQWYLNGSEVQGATGFTWTFMPISIGFYNVYVIVTDGVGSMAESNITAVVVNPSPSVSVSPTLIGLVVGQSQLFTSNVLGGTGSYFYQWFLDGVPFSGATNATWVFTPTSVGFYTVYVNVNDSVGVQATSDNATVTVHIHDVAVTNVNLSKCVVGQGDDLNVTVTAANLGDVPETFNLTVYASLFIASQNVTLSFACSQNVTLSSGNSLNITFVLNTAGYPYGNYTISAYAWPVPGETNISNNNYTSGVVTISIPGDVDGTGRVNMGDIVSLCMAFGSTPGQPNWNPNCDIENNGKIDMGDIIIACANFGQYNP
jgi:parallel beta-helix repeat protein